MLSKIRSKASAALNTATQCAKSTGQWFIDDIKANPRAWLTVLVCMIMLAVGGVHVIDLETLEVAWGLTITLYTAAATVILGFAKTIITH